MKEYLKQATEQDVPVIWEILQEAISKRKSEGSSQWQDGYPNLDVIASDIKKKAAYVLIAQDEIVGYVSLLVNGEPEYDNLIGGDWLTGGDYLVFHRVAIAKNHLGKGYAKKMMELIEAFAKELQVDSIKADTNHDNFPMLSIFKKRGYVYCGQVYFRNSPRNAYQKVVISEKIKE